MARSPSGWQSVVAVRQLPRVVRRATTLALLLLLPAVPATATLKEGPRLAAIYDTVLAARFNEAAETLDRACPPAPREACLDLAAALTWWRIQLDPDNRALDDQFQEQARAAIDAAEHWTDRDAGSAEAWFYLAGAYGPLVEWRVLRGHRVAAARDGNRIRQALERALSLDPSLNDAYFGIGLYHYYAAVAPLAAKVLRWFLFLPGGDREQGLQEIVRARERGLLLSGEAEYQLQRIYLWYEHRPADALALLRELDARYPTNPIFLQRIAEVYANDEHDHRQSRDAWEQLLDRARSGNIAHADLVASRAERALAKERAAITDDTQKF
jgi:tetratricopeptide (TPR) repeat protein